LKKKRPSVNDVMEDFCQGIPSHIKEGLR